MYVHTFIHSVKKYIKKEKKMNNKLPLPFGLIVLLLRDSESAPEDLVSILQQLNAISPQGGGVALKRDIPWH